MVISLLVPAIIATVMSAIFWGRYLIEWRDFLKAKHWQSALATIVSSKPVGMSDSGTFWPEVIYEFGYGGEIFRGRRTHFGGSVVTGSLQQAKCKCEGFPEGRVLPVYFDQGNPEKSVLLPKEISGLLTAGVLLVAASFVPAFFWMLFYLAR